MEFDDRSKGKHQKSDCFEAIIDLHEDEGGWFEMDLLGRRQIDDIAENRIDISWAVAF